MNYGGNTYTPDLRQLQKARNGEDKSDSDIIGILEECEDLKAVLNKVKKYADTDLPILFLGSTGTGKTELARYAHLISNRRKGPFVKINCASIPPGLFESEIFGWEKGAFTGAINRRKGYFFQANNGTLFIDEVGELTKYEQAILLDAIETKRFRPIGSEEALIVDCRVIMATNKDILAEYQNRLIREDFFWRIYQVPIELPPLKQRKRDILKILSFILDNFCTRNKIVRPKMDHRAIKLILGYKWPGNIRQLKTTIERSAIECENKLITNATIKSILGSFYFEEKNHKVAMNEFEKEFIEGKILGSKNNQEAATDMNIHLNTLKGKIRKHNINSRSLRQNIRANY